MVKLIHRTNDAEALIAYMARVSSPNQDNPDFEKLLKYLIKNAHWSPMEMVNFCIEINTTRAIAQQILRHKSFFFQEFSGRYSKITQNIPLMSARRQDEKNRQNSIDDLDSDIQNWFLNAQSKVNTQAKILYEEALNKGIAKESARFLLPLSTPTKMYMNGTIRSWIHYFLVRCDVSTQFEHREIALAAWNIFKQEFPVISNVLKELHPNILK